METITVQDILAATPNEVVQMMKKTEADRDFREFLKQYDPKQHKVNKAEHRPNKIKKTDQGVMAVPVARLSLPMQKLIVSRAAAFLIGEGITLTASPENDTERERYEKVKQVWHDQKLDYRTRQMARTWMSETQVAEYWYIKDKALRLGVWAHSMGDTLYPYFDEYGDLIAFGRGFTVGGNEFMDLYTESHIISLAKYTNWEEEKREVNPWGKIPVVFYDRECPEWFDVQEMVERLETMISNFADTNDYFASPIVKVRGKITGFAEKGEAGKVVTLEENADVSFLTWQQAPEAIKLEKETLLELIFSMTQTPDISFEKMRGVGNIAGIALEMMFMDAKLKSLSHQEEFGEGLQRRLNLIKRGLDIIEKREVDLRIEPEFNFYMPDNEKELIDMLVMASGNRAVMSRETALRNNPFVTNVEQEKEMIEDDDAGQFGNIIP